ncbi:hypothetical protein I7I50_07949 [Histoplasma capsulatum G186AR]|uniref:Uncharacterized protein n=1 Tax=Ajellomyces capsulatus TaxID=5037 RepID=A0A8H7YKN0_AJECA|nr:hypothetical protein I7I52_08465 [Histoplasma capsulatum]QSS68511.1 hypothetical protein I7I50_07949 [Histoplasma capsulatum G186AR]
MQGSMFARTKLVFLHGGPFFFAVTHDGFDRAPSFLSLFSLVLHLPTVGLHSASFVCACIIWGDRRLRAWTRWMNPQTHSWSLMVERSEKPM